MNGSRRSAGIGAPASRPLSRSMQSECLPPQSESTWVSNSDALMGYRIEPTRRRFVFALVAGASLGVVGRIAWMMVPLVFLVIALIGAGARIAASNREDSVPSIL